jgi:hypothetical protein
MTGFLTGGKFTYGRTVQPAQYESKKAEAEIAFAVSEGSDQSVFDATLTLAVTTAMNTVHTAVGLKAPAKAEVTAQVAVAQPEKKAAAPSKPPATKKVERTKADIEKDHAAELAKLAADKKPAAADPAAIEDVKPNITASPEDRKDPAAVDDFLMDDAAPVVELTDKELNAICTSKSAELQKAGVVNAATLIRQLIGKYGVNLASIAKADRPKFKAEVDALEVPKK